MTHTITSLQNRRVKSAIKLRNRRGRVQQGRILIDGARELSQAVQANVELLELFVCSELCTSPLSRQLVSHISDAEVLYVDEPVFSKLAFGQRSEGIMGVATTPRRNLDDLALDQGALIVVLEGVEKPGNLGAVIRSADGAGASAVVVTGVGTDLFNPNVIRASLGTVFTLPVCAADQPDALDWLCGGGVQILTARVDAATDYVDVNLTGPTAIVLGSESAGLSPAWNATHATPIKLPMRGTADSLNVSATAAVLLYEARRQRG